MTISVHKLPSIPPIIAVCDYERSFDNEEGNRLYPDVDDVTGQGMENIVSDPDRLELEWGKAPIKILVVLDNTSSSAPAPAPVPAPAPEASELSQPDTSETPNISDIDIDTLSESAPSFVLLIKRNGTAATGAGLFTSIAMSNSPEGEDLQQNPTVLKELENLIEEETMLAASCLYYGITPDPDFGDPLDLAEAQEIYDEAFAEYETNLILQDLDDHILELSVSESESESELSAPASPDLSDFNQALGLSEQEVQELENQNPENNPESINIETSDYAPLPLGALEQSLQAVLNAENWLNAFRLQDPDFRREWLDGLIAESQANHDF